VTESESETVVSRLTSSEEERSRAGSRVVLAVAWEAEATPRPCPPGPWVPVALAVKAASVAALAEASEVVNAVGSAVVSATAAVEDSGADSEIVVVDSATVDSIAAAAVTATSAAPTASRPRTHQMALGVVATAAVKAVSATTGEAALALDTAVGMAVKAAVAHMTIDPVAEASVGAIATPDRRAATWSPSDLAVRTVGIATRVAAAEAETLTGQETTTIPGSAVSRAATKIPGSCDATNKTDDRLVVGINTSQFRCSTPPFPLCDNEGKPATLHFHVHTPNQGKNDRVRSCGSKFLRSAKVILCSSSAKTKATDGSVISSGSTTFSHKLTASQAAPNDARIISVPRKKIASWVGR